MQLVCGHSAASHSKSFVFRPVRAAVERCFEALPGDIVLSLRHVLRTHFYDTLTIYAITFCAERDHAPTFTLEFKQPWLATASLVPGQPLLLFYLEYQRTALGGLCLRAGRPRWLSSCCPCPSGSAQSRPGRNSGLGNRNRTPASTALPAGTRRSQSRRAVDRDPQLPTFQLVRLPQLFQIFKERDPQRSVHHLFVFREDHACLTFNGLDHFPVRAVPQQFKHLGQQHFALVNVARTAGLGHLVDKPGRDFGA